MHNNLSHINGIETPIYNENINRYNKSRFIHNIEILSHNSDSRSNNLEIDLENCSTHSFRIYCGSNGYAYDDDIEYIIKNLPKKAIDNFNKYCYPILDYLDLKKDPEILIVNQIW